MDHSEPNLRTGALRLPSVVMQAVTHIAPGTGLILTLQLITKHSGQTAPLAFAIGFVIMLCLGMSLAELAKHIPSAGVYYTYVSRTVHPRAGFLTAWLYFLYDPVATAINLTFVGFLTEKSLMAAYGITVPWWAFTIVTALLISFLAYRGIEVSLEFTVILGIAEVLLLLALAATGFLKPGEGGLNLHSFSFENIPRDSALALGIVYTIFCFSGFEAVAPLAEESKNPKRNLPLAIVGSVVIMGFVYIFCSWGFLTGWGTDVVTSFVNIPDEAQNPPFFQLAKQLWGGGWIVILLVLVNSAIGVSMAATNATTRVFFAMGRSGSLPKVLARIHPVYQTPVVAVAVQTVLTFLVGLGLGFAIGPKNEFDFLAVATSLGLVCVYCAGNLGVFLFFFRHVRNEFSIFRHLLLPLTSSLGMLYVGYKTIYPWPDPFDPPASYAPYLVIVWLLLGIGLLTAMKCFGREEWLLKAGQAAYEHPAAPQSETK
jgi:amino acid transporter